MLAGIILGVILWSAWGSTVPLWTLLLTAGPVLLALLLCAPHLRALYLMTLRPNSWNHRQVLFLVRFYGKRKWGVRLESPAYNPELPDDGTRPVIRLRLVPATGTGVDLNREFTLTLNMATYTQWYFLMLDYDLEVVSAETARRCVEHDCTHIAHLGYDGHRAEPQHDARMQHNHE